MAVLSQMTGFLALPVEIRLCIYDLLIGPSECYASPAPYLCFSIKANTLLSPVLSRCGFRKWDFRRTPVWTKWPAHDATALSLTCRQIHLDLSEYFHPPLTIYSLTIVEDTKFKLVEGEKLYAGLNERSWLFARLKILRLELTNNAQARFATQGEANNDKSNFMNGLRRWSGKVIEDIIRSHRVPRDDKARPVNKLADFLRTVPQLRKVELYIRCTAVLKSWAQPFDDLQALHSLGVVFAVIIGYQVPIECLRIFIASQGGELTYLNPSNAQEVESRIGASTSTKRFDEDRRTDMCIVSRDKTFVSSAYCEEDDKRRKKMVGVGLANV